MGRRRDDVEADFSYAGHVIGWATIVMVIVNFRRYQALDYSVPPGVPPEVILRDVVVMIAIVLAVAIVLGAYDRWMKSSRAYRALSHSPLCFSMSSGIVVYSISSIGSR